MSQPMTPSSTHTVRPTKRLWVESICPGPLALPREQSHYLCRVLRLENNDQLWVFDGYGLQAKATITTCDPNHVILDVAIPISHPGPPLELTVALPAPKHQRADWIVEKLTELGVQHITWLHTEFSSFTHSISAKRLERWQRLSQAAAQQSGSWVASLQGPIPLTQLLTENSALRLVASPNGQALASTTLIQQIKAPPTPLQATLLVGPEGGFSQKEQQLIAEAGSLEWRFNDNILRIETAALAGVSLLMAAFSATDPNS